MSGLMFFDFPIAIAVLSIVGGVFSMGLFGIVAVILTVELWFGILVGAVLVDLCWDVVQLLLVLVALLAGGG